MPLWMKGAIAIFIGYALITKNSQPPASKTPTKAAPFNISDYKKLLPNFSQPLTIKDIKLGDGQAVTCGQDVSIAYETFLPSDKALPIGATEAAPLTFKPGEGKVVPALEKGVVGMLPGGTRSVNAMPELAYGNPAFARDDAPKDSAVRFEILLIDAKPLLPDPKSSPFRVAYIKNSVGNAAFCGDKVKAAITVWDAEGKKLYSTKDEGQSPISFTLGKSEVFLGLEQGAIGMAPGAVRTLIVPPDYQKTMSGASPTVTIPLPPHQTVLVDIEALP